MGNMAYTIWPLPQRRDVECNVDDTRLQSDITYRSDHFFEHFIIL